MKVTQSSKGEVSITASTSEMAFLSNAINETLNALEVWEFQTRTGATVEQAKKMQLDLQRVLDDAQPN